MKFFILTPVVLLSRTHLSSCRTTRNDVCKCQGFAAFVIFLSLSRPPPSSWRTQESVINVSDRTNRFTAPAGPRKIWKSSKRLAEHPPSLPSHYDWAWINTFSPDIARCMAKDLRKINMRYFSEKFTLMKRKFNDKAWESWNCLPDVSELHNATNTITYCYLARKIDTPVFLDKANSTTLWLKYRNRESLEDN